MLEPDRHPRIPAPGELGPDPEPLGSERFLRLMHTLETQRPLPAEPLVLPVPRRRVSSREGDQAAA
jgi:hypothetical protein